MRVGLLLARLPLPLRNDRPVETTKPSIELATGRNEGNEDKAVRQREKEAEMGDAQHQARLSK